MCVTISLLPYQSPRTGYAAQITYARRVLKDLISQQGNRKKTERQDYSVYIFMYRQTSFFYSFLFHENTLYHLYYMVTNEIFSFLYTAFCTNGFQVLRKHVVISYYEFVKYAKYCIIGIGSGTSGLGNLCCISMFYSYPSGTLYHTSDVHACPWGLRKGRTL